MDYTDIQADRLSFPSPDGLRKLLNMLGTDREKEIRSLLGVIFQIEHLPQLDLAYLESVGRSMNERVLDEVFRVHGEASVEVLKLYRTVGDLYNYRHFHDYYRALEHLLISINDYIIGIRTAHSEHADMEEALAYIEDHYSRPLNMAMVSNYVSLSYSYFSEAFKAYTGESFVVYLKKSASAMQRNYCPKTASSWRRCLRLSGSRTASSLPGYLRSWRASLRGIPDEAAGEAAFPRG